MSVREIIRLTTNNRNIVILTSYFRYTRHITSYTAAVHVVRRMVTDVIATTSYYDHDQTVANVIKVSVKYKVYFQIESK